MNSYQKPTVGAGGPEEEVETGQFLVPENTFAPPPADGTGGKPRRRVMVLAAAAVFGLAVVFLLASGRPEASSVTAVSLLGTGSPSSSSGPAACTFAECTSSNCNADVAPYTCLFHNGGVHGGCSPIPWTDETCTKQCDLTGCAGLKIPDSYKDCSGACPDDWCSLGRECGSEAPYQCTSGAATFGCSADPYHWTVSVSEVACATCCDATTCSGGSD